MRAAQAGAGFAPGVDPQLGEHPLGMVACRVGADAEPLGDGRVRAPLFKEPRDFDLARSHLVLQLQLPSLLFIQGLLPRLLHPHLLHRLANPGDQQPALRPQVPESGEEAGEVRRLGPVGVRFMIGVHFNLGARGLAFGMLNLVHLRRVLAVRGLTPASVVPEASGGRAEEACIRPARLEEDASLDWHPVGEP